MFPSTDGRPACTLKHACKSDTAVGNKKRFQTTPATQPWQSRKSHLAVNRHQTNKNKNMHPTPVGPITRNASLLLTRTARQGRHTPAARKGESRPRIPHPSRPKSLRSNGPARRPREGIRRSARTPERAECPERRPGPETKSLAREQSPAKT